MSFKSSAKAILVLFALMMSNKGFAKDLDAAISAILDIKTNRSFNGVVLIAKDDQVLYKKAQGDYGDPKLDSQFIIGSVSKQITAVTVLSLVEKGSVKLDEPIYVYLPDLKEKWATEVTVRHLLNHTSGIGALGEDLAFEPGLKFKYSPAVTYYLLSQIAEKVSGMKYEKLLGDLFYKAGMEHSYISFSRNTKELYKHNPKLAYGYKELEGVIAETITLDEGVDLTKGKWIHPGGGVVSSADDLLSWNLALHKGKLLSEETYKLMIAPSATRNHPRYGEISYGLGVQLLEKDGIFEISHSGYIDGYTSTLIYYPESQISVIVLENISWSTSDTKRAFVIHDQIREVVRKYI